MPRKSTASNQSGDGEATPVAVKDGISVEDLGLPRTMVQRLAKGVLPANTQIQKDALLAISKSATVFVNYLSTHANDAAQRASKKTIQPKDVFAALEELDFGGFAPRCEGELAKFQSVQCDKRNSYRRKVREEAKAKAAADAANGVVEAIPGPPVATIPTFSVRNRDAPPAAKKMRAMGVGADAGDAEGEGRPVAVGEGEDADEDDEGMGEDGADEDDEMQVDDEEEEDDDDDDDGPPEGEDEDDADDDPAAQLVEDPLEEREGENEDEDDVLGGDESD